MTRKNLDHRLQGIRDELLYLSSMVEAALVNSVSVLKSHDLEKSRLVHRNDLRINAECFELERQIIFTIARSACFV
ncbi:hypothetical protein [Candidatus Villigracilis saccharophilus]|uniref:hypothetical protein n=1 Tax=Candidatus Villigracilis saccharophilus TaxID=3140684 RepID=UPI00313471DF|nr:hypothetical protein [Anaerolineales bacterium]